MIADGLSPSRGRWPRSYRGRSSQGSDLNLNLTLTLSRNLTLTLSRNLNLTLSLNLSLSLPPSPPCQPPADGPDLVDLPQKIHSPSIRQHTISGKQPYGGSSFAG